MVPLKEQCLSKFHSLGFVCPPVNHLVCQLGFRPDWDEVKALALSNFRVVYHYKGYRYFEHKLKYPRSRNPTIYLRCLCTDNGACRVRVLLFPDKTVRIRGIHNHPPEIDKLNRDVMTAIKPIPIYFSQSGLLITKLALFIMLMLYIP